MRKRIPVGVLALLTGLVLVGGVWAQKSPPPTTVGGIITTVDLANHEIAVRNDDGGRIFQWNKETKINGPGEKALIFEDLKEGMMVTVSYREGERDRVANRIDVKTANIKTLKGIELPFECGMKVC